MKGKYHLKEEQKGVKLMMLFCLFLNKNRYRNDPKFSDRLVLKNSADPDQTAPRGAV